MWCIVFNLICSLNFECKKREKETQYEMFFLRNNSLLTWLGNNYTNPFQEAGVFTTLCVIHSRGDFCLNFCRYGVPHALIVIFFPSIFWGLWHCPEKFQTYLEGRKKRSKRERKQVKRNKHSLDFLSHLEKSHEPWSLYKCLFFVPPPLPSLGHTFPFRGKNRAGNIQFTRRQRRWFHWQYNNMLHGA